MYDLFVDYGYSLINIVCFWFIMKFVGLWNLKSIWLFLNFVKNCIESKIFVKLDVVDENFFFFEYLILWYVSNIWFDMWYLIECYVVLLRGVWLVFYCNDE